MITRDRLVAILLLMAAGTTAAAASAESSTADDYRIQDHYSTRDYRIAMRDGTELHTTVVAPKTQSGPLPILLNRSPYRCYFPPVPPAFLAKARFVFVFQDARGTCKSGGQWLDLSPPRDKRAPGSRVDESTDANDTIKWLLAHVPNNNGNVGLWGGSYEAFYVQASIEAGSPAIKAAVISAMDDWNYRHGAFLLGDSFEFYIFFGPKHQEPVPYEYWTKDSYEFFLTAGPLSQLTARTFDHQEDPNPAWRDLLEHSTLDKYWKDRDLLSRFRGIRCAVLNVGSFFDQFAPSGPVNYYHAIRKQNPNVPADLLVMGPWSHATDSSPSESNTRLGDIDFGSDAGAEYQRTVLLPFLDRYLKGGHADLPNASVFDTGAHVWSKFEQWPPASMARRKLYFGANGSLSFDVSPKESSYSEYLSDPSKPVPIMGSTQPTEQVIPKEYMTADQRFAARRPDVLVFQTEPLTEDVTLAGSVVPDLFVSTEGTDSDWDVKLIDVYPPDYIDSKDSKSGSNPVAAAESRNPTERANAVSLAGYQLLVRGEPMRGKFRNGWEKAEPFTPGVVTSVSYKMADVYHTFRKSHRIMIQVQSTMFPLTDINPQTFVDIAKAKPEDFHKASQRVYFGGRTSSNLEVGVIGSSHK